MADIVTGTDLIIRRFMEQWNADSPAIVGGPAPKVCTEATEPNMKPHPRETGATWARITVRHATGTAAALGNTKFARTGTVFVQIFVPFTAGDAYTVAQRLAKVAQTAYEGQRAGGVLFPSVATPERGPEGSYYRADCVASFEYHETK